ncbi:zinc-binding dehydrogenase [Demequina sp. SYSU T00192]|uniref:Zinc-binding dehydrogenase n=1 Tax=Demequina litoralis TaxID=3051660 RepID=A0ABT8G6B4_9MICO|nr:zinc-binding dehydrogenase [Demequina sp. SYSU T00192]MDN4474676.1 zinc-binding dehydrogenase [Demequina sp. SYSU T00192]
MKALLLDAPGLDHLRIGEVPDPAPGPGDVLVEVEACGLNPVDAWTAGSGHPAWDWPHVPGLDVVGTVVALGADVDGFAPGDRIAVHSDLRRDGGLAALAAVPALACARVPDGLGAAEAAALPCAGLTALQAVERRLRVGPADTVLVTAAAGGVGGFAVQLAAAAGARVLATASSPRRDEVLALGAETVIDYRTEDVAGRVRELTGGRGVDAVVDTVSAASATANLGLLVHGGGIACVASRADLTAVPEFTVAPSVHEISLGAAHASGDDRAVRWLATGLADLLGRVAAGTLDPRVRETVALDEVPDALARLAGRHVAGKIVAVVRP